MSRQIDIISTSDSAHYLQIGFDSNSLASFEMQLYITKIGKRAVDWLQSLSLSYCSFMGGVIYLHNSNEVPRLMLFGEQKDAKVGVVLNEKASTTKLLDSLGIFTDGEWEVESVTINPDKNYPNGQYSRIPARNFRKREGVLYSEFLRNAKTSSGTIKPIEYLTGEQLRGNAAYLVLKHTGTDDVQLWRIDLNVTSSR